MASKALHNAIFSIILSRFLHWNEYFTYHIQVQFFINFFTEIDCLEIFEYNIKKLLLIFTIVDLFSNVILLYCSYYHILLISYRKKIMKTNSVYCTFVFSPCPMICEVTGLLLLYIRSNCNTQSSKSGLEKIGFCG